MPKIIILCVPLVLTWACGAIGETTNKAAEEALRKGLKADENNDLNSAVINYTKAIEFDLKYAGAYYNRGLVYAIKEIQRRHLGLHQSN
jgi:Tfp pilus assembly protein PilF